MEPRRHHHRRRVHRAAPGAIVPPGAGSLDIPLSVWAASESTDLTAGLIGELCPSGGLVATIGIVPEDVPAPSPRFGLVAITDPHDATQLEHIAQAGGLVDVTTRENAACRLASMPAAVDLVIVSGHWSVGEGMWTACAVALKTGGYVAVITATSNPAAHATMHRRATAAGLRYQHHIVSVSARDLTRASQIDPTQAPPSHRMRGRHRDVFIYTNPAGGRA